MAQNINNKKIRFWSKSLLWSSLLYIATILVLDWNDLKKHFNNTSSTIVHINNTEQNPGYSIAVDTISKTIRTIPKSIISHSFSILVKEIIAN